MTAPLMAAVNAMTPRHRIALDSTALIARYGIDIEP